MLRVFDDTGLLIGTDDDAGFGEDPELIFVAPALDDHCIGISGKGYSSYASTHGTGTAAGSVGEFEVIGHLTQA